jgi:hypothetical protein
MSFALLTPPPDSPFRVEYDGQGRIRLTWRKPVQWPAEFASFVGFLVAGAFAGAFTAHIIGPVVGYGVTLLFALLKAAVLLEWLIPDGLTLGEAALRCDCYDPNDPAVRRPERVIPRTELGFIRLVRVAPGPNGQPRQYLALHHRAERVLIGRDLRESDLEWLAGVLRAWAAEEKRPAPAGRAARGTFWNGDPNSVGFAGPGSATRSRRNG